ncbi:uncharacterized protein ASCRUDRAFT_155995 [Ascoidea rubescens DSM 1968]|uniref:Uncharacterized protein n=1 Tax=Ascoidea rubescens DSM 1968 TaxID=1344418 RepID=A0A1D2VER6_9ASCO|nr:hypothetical protein ASCRUDRAFT_155995 [Ascoidea rubescens DSM 1968]ODV60072.1 hypothetical protein ASCRUDRAFT_155995 [Ascoidea rubescens DSM 1968]
MLLKTDYLVLLVQKSSRSDQLMDRPLLLRNIYCTICIFLLWDFFDTFDDHRRSIKVG